MPDSTILVDYMLARLTALLRGLRILPENMARNLAASYGLYFSQRLLLALVGSGMARQAAYEMVQKVAMRCWNERLFFPDEIKKDERITQTLSAEQLAEVFDAGYYLRHVDHIFGRVFE